MKPLRFVDDEDTARRLDMVSKTDSVSWMDSGASPFLTSYLSEDQILDT